MSQQQQNVLKRSHKADFASEMNRERSFVRQSVNSKEKRRSQTFVKPAIELYRPPNVRTDLSPSSGKLNVHAKEFTMLQEHPDELPLLHSSKSGGNLSQIMQQQQQQHYQHYQHNSLQHSKSSGSILKNPPGAAAWQFIPVHAGLHMPAHTGLLHSNSTSTLIQHLHHHNQQQQQIAAAAAAASAAAAAAAAHRVSFHHHQQQQHHNHHRTPLAFTQPQQQSPLQFPAAIYNTPTSSAIVANATHIDTLPATSTSFAQAQQQLMTGAGLCSFNGLHMNGNASSLLLKRSKSFTTTAPDQQSTTILSSPFAISRQNYIKNLANISESHSSILGSKHLSPSPSSISNLSTSNTLIAQLEELIGSYPTEEERRSLRGALDDPQLLPTRTLMDLVRVIMERLVQEGMTYAERAAQLCVAIAEKEREIGRETFIESLVNTCQQWYQERDKILRSIKSGDGTRFTAFMWFLTELFTRLKRHQHHARHTEAHPQPADLILLSVLAKCCQACVSHPIRCLAETECLFFVLTSIGRELELELPQQLDQLLASVRDGFLDSSGSASVRKTLLQLIELHASNWQLTGSSVLYYYPRIK